MSRAAFRGFGVLSQASVGGTDPRFAYENLVVLWLLALVLSSRLFSLERRVVLINIAVLYPFVVSLIKIWLLRWSFWSFMLKALMFSVEVLILFHWGVNLKTLTGLVAL